jgi:hypothetical protein
VQVGPELECAYYGVKKDASALCCLLDIIMWDFTAGDIGGVQHNYLGRYVGLDWHCTTLPCTNPSLRPILPTGSVGRRSIITRLLQSTISSIRDGLPMQLYKTFRTCNPRAKQ